VEGLPFDINKSKQSRSDIMNNIKPMNKRFKNILLIVSLFLVLISYFLLQPRVSNIFPFIREYRLSSFIRNTIKNKNISTQEFWELREFYSPGSILLEKPNLTYTSAKIISYETLVSKDNTLKTHISFKRDWHILYQNTNELIASSGKTTYIYFIKPISEMSKANGFFDYKDQDKKLLETKNWYVETKILK
jgi:hypothetical protein